MNYFITFVSVLIVYLFLAGFTVSELVVGSIVSAVLTMILIRRLRFNIDARFPFALVKFLVIYIPVFTWRLVLANIDVAKRVLTPVIPLNPAIVKVPTNLRGNFGKLTLANSITLTPGTLSIDVMNDALFVHTVDLNLSRNEQGECTIGQDFEKILGGIF